VNGVGVYVAKPISRRQANRIGLLLHVGGLTDPYTSEILLGVRREAARRDIEIVFLDEENMTVDPNKVDAILMYCHETEALAMCLPPQLPHVLLFQHSAEFTCVTVNDFDGAKMAAKHLIDLGHTRIAYLLSSDHDSVSRRRLAGFQAAHQDAGIPLMEDQVQCLHDIPVVGYREAGEIGMKTWLKNGWRRSGFTSIMTHNDESAIGVIKVLVAAGLRVPEDVSVVGFDGTKISDLSTPALTTVRVPLYDLGTRAIKILAEQMKEEKIYQEKVVLPVTWKKGESTSICER
jgi:DNA-binding LacI/PurR family transcriptional regulator